MATSLPESVIPQSDSIILDDDFDVTFQEPPSSPFVSHIEIDDQENIAPNTAPLSSKPLLDLQDEVPQSAFKVSPEKRSGLKERARPNKSSPVRNLMGDFEEAALTSSNNGYASLQKSSPSRQLAADRPKSATSNRSRKSLSPAKAMRAASNEIPGHSPPLDNDPTQSVPPLKRPSSRQDDYALRDNEGLTIAMRHTEENRMDSQESRTGQQSLEDDFELDLGNDNTDYNPDGPDLASTEIDDTCFSTFSEMPGIDMTKFAFLKQSPAKKDILEVSIIMFE